MSTSAPRAYCKPKDKSIFFLEQILTMWIFNVIGFSSSKKKLQAKIKEFLSDNNPDNGYFCCRLEFDWSGTEFNVANLLLTKC